MSFHTQVYTHADQLKVTQCRCRNNKRFMVAVTCPAVVVTCMLQSRCCAAHAAQHPQSVANAVPAGSKQSFTVLAVGADGNCMFRALAQSRSFCQGAAPHRLHPQSHELLLENVFLFCASSNKKPYTVLLAYLGTECDNRCMSSVQSGRHIAVRICVRAH